MRDEEKQDLETKTKAANIISVGITWVDSRILFKPGTKWADMWFGICHYSDMIFAITTQDYQKPLMINTISCAPPENYCEKAGSCLYFKCHMNRFHKDLFVNEFKDCGLFSLGMPLNFGQVDLWFNLPPYSLKWKDFALKPEGGQLRYDPEKSKRIITL
jgi:hypothetical protein